jgi:hypothetical protein
MPQIGAWEPRQHAHILGGMKAIVDSSGVGRPIPSYCAGMLVQGVLRSIRLSRPVRTRPGPTS